MKDESKLPALATKLFDKVGYFDHFYEIVSGEDHPTHYEAYLRVERLYLGYFGRNRYSSYESFRVMKSHYMKLLSKQRVNLINIKSV